MLFYFSLVIFYFIFNFLGFPLCIKSVLFEKIPREWLSMLCLSARRPLA